MAPLLPVRAFSVGYDGGTVVNPTQPYSNVQLWDTLGSPSGYDISNPYAATLELQPLVATLRSNFPTTANPTSGYYLYPGNMFGESPDVSYCNNRTSLALSDGYSQYVASTTCVGVSGVLFGTIYKGTPGEYPSNYGNSYAASIYEVTAINNLTKKTISSATIGNPTAVHSANHGLITGNYAFIQAAAGMTELNGYWQVTVIDANNFTVNLNSTHSYTGDGYLTSYGVVNILLTHGETDSYYGTDYVTYAGYCTSMIADYNADVSAVTGQTQTIYMLASQQHTFGLFWYQCPYINTSTHALLSLIGTPNFFLSGPKYQYPYFPDEGPHLTGEGYAQVGDKYAQCARSIEQTGNWLPCYPTSVVKNNGSANGVGTTSVTATFHVPVAPLVFDTSLGNPHQTGLLSNVWMNGKGFEAIDITSLVITNATNASPIQITTSTAHGLSTGQYISIPSVAGNTAANGVFQITVVDTDNFTLNGSTGNGAFAYSTSVPLPGLFGYPLYQIAILLPITSVSLTGNQITIALGSSAGTQLAVGYADTSDAGGYAGGFAEGGRCGCVRDSDPYKGRTDANNYNWLCEFYQNIS